MSKIRLQRTKLSPRIIAKANILVFNLWVFLSLVLIGTPLCIAQGVTTFTLQESIDFARENSKNIKVALEKVELERGKVNEAISVMLPNLSGSGSYAYFVEPLVILDEKAIADMQKALESIFPPGMPVPQPTEGQSQESTAIEADKHNYRASVTLQQPLFTWGKLLNNYKQAKLNLQAALQGLESVK